MTRTGSGFVDAASTARDVVGIASEGGCLNDLWRFGILQTIDLYHNDWRLGGRTRAKSVFTREPITGVAEIDCAYAALAEYLAERDGWSRPSWTSRPCKCDRPWLPAQRPEYDLPERVIDEAIEQAPDSFRVRNIYVGLDDLARV